MGRFPLGREGNYFVTLLSGDETLTTTATGEENSFETPSSLSRKGQAYGTAVFSLPYAGEFRNITSFEGFLETAAAISGGSMLSPEKPLGPDFFIPNPDLPSYPFIPRPFIILAAIVFFFIALFLRLLPEGILKTLLGRFQVTKEGENYTEIKKKMEKEKEMKSRPLRDDEFWFGKR